MRCLGYIKRGKRPFYRSLSTVQRTTETKNGNIPKKDQTSEQQVLSKIEHLYKEAFSVTKGKPSAALLNALKQQAAHDGVNVTGQKIESLELHESNKKKTRVRGIRGSDLRSIAMLNTYLDIYLTKNELTEFLQMLEKCGNISITSVDQSIIMRYVFKCKRTSVKPQIELPELLQTLCTAMGFFYKEMFSQLNEMHCKVIDQSFVNEIIAKYAFYPTDFEDFKVAMKIVDPSLTFSVAHEKIQHEALADCYPVIKSLYSKYSASVLPYSKTEYDIDVINTQLSNETFNFTGIKSISNEQYFCEDLWKYKSELQNKWAYALYKSMLTEFKRYKRGDYKEFRSHYCPILDNDVICLKAVAKEVTHYICENLHSQGEGLEVYKGASAIGNMVYTTYCKNHQKFHLNEYQQYINTFREFPEHSPQTVWESETQQEFHQFKPHWCNMIINGVGGFILNLVRIHFKYNPTECTAALQYDKSKRLTDTTTEHERVFEHTYYISKTTKKNFPVGVFLAAPDVKKVILKNIQTRGYFNLETVDVPMLCPPKPWLYSYLTPMLTREVRFIRSAGADWARYYVDILQHCDRTGHLDVIKHGLDVLGTLPWAVNNEILQKQVKVFNDGGLEKLSIACAFTAKFPPPPDMENATKKEVKDHHRAKYLLNKEKSEKYSQRCTQLYTLSLGTTLAGAPFWHCYNLDFRGRVYPVAPHYSHMLGDPARGTLLFNEGAPLGEAGLRWLKVHCVNKFGAIRKATFEEKVRYAEDWEAQIMESADNMCTDKGWWAQSTEDPWQCLAACIELTAALRSGDPHAHVSRLPVSMDGSCNGLQHYAALGKDYEGAVKVNVAPSPAPEDVYIAVMNIVEELRQADCEAGDLTALKAAGWIERKTLKQTVMTQVYGVTQYGAREQIRGKLIDKGMAPADVNKCAKYLSKLTFKAVGKLFTQAQEIQDWLNKAAYQIAGGGKPVQWSTPLGLPCVQPYTTSQRSASKTPLQSVDVSGAAPGMPVNKQKQKSAFPPNFVHSQDSTHMLMTAIKCYHAGIPFAAVHDSFWTLPCHVDEMNRILREQFVVMYSYDVLKQLKGSFEETNPDLQFEDLPHFGGLDINTVKDSKYFFS